MTACAQLLNNYTDKLVLNNHGELYMAVQYPLDIRFKLVALAPRMFVTDASGNNVSFVSQKVIALKEDIQVFTDESRKQELYHINADRIVDFSPQSRVTDSTSNHPVVPIAADEY